ncbi:hypothetical protein ACT7DB_17355 [Bacillus cereus]
MKVYLIAYGENREVVVHFSKKGIIPPNSTIGTGYLCKNPNEELYITVSRKVSQVIFKGKVANLKENLLTHNEMSFIISDRHMLFLQRPSKSLENKVELFIRGTGNSINDSTESSVPKELYRELWWEINVTVDKVPFKIKEVLPPFGGFINKSIFEMKFYNLKITDIPIKKQGHTEIIITAEQFSRLKPVDGVKDHWDPSLLNPEIQIRPVTKKIIVSSNTTFEMQTPTSIVGLYCSPSLSSSDLKPNENIDRLHVFKIGEPHQTSYVHVFNKQSKNVLCKIFNLYDGRKEPTSHTISSMSSIKIDNGSVRNNDRARFNMITVDDIPIYTGISPEYELPDEDALKSAIQKLNRIDPAKLIWHMNLNDINNLHTYDYMAIEGFDSCSLNAIHSFEVILNNNSMGKVCARPPELDNRIIINFFDYNQNINDHPKQNDDITIIVHDIFGNQRPIYKGKAYLTNEIWKCRYRVSEWHQVKTGFDAVYLQAVPTGLTESVKSYDIQIGQDIYRSVSFERQDNDSYIRDQRLKLDFIKNKIPKEKLPKFGDHIILTIHTLENDTITIDLGKVEESKSATSINALEKVHEITNWRKNGDHFTGLHFNKGSEHITSYVLKVNNRYYGEIPVSKITTDLDISNLNSEKKIQKGDYVEIYAYKQDGEGVLIQSRFAGTTGLIGNYPDRVRIQQECHVTSWGKTNDRYTSVTLESLSDPVDSYIKKYEGYINNKIVMLTQEGKTFTFDAKQIPHRGDIVHIIAYTYTGETAELWKLPAGATGSVNDEDVRSIHTLKSWEDSNQTIVFDTSQLKEPIQAYIKSYTIEIGKPPYIKWEKFGKPISLTSDGKLHLKDCGVQPLPSHTNRDIIRITANLFNEKEIIILDAQPIGLIKKTNNRTSSTSS